MNKHRLTRIVVLVIAFLLLFPARAYAYMDPGTTGSIFAMLAPFIAIFLTFLGFIIRPFRRFFSSIISRFRRGNRVESEDENEKPVPGDLPDGDDGEKGQ